MGLFGFTSCTDRLEEVEEQYTGENEVWVRLIVSRPYSGKEVRSKAGNDRETEIDESQLLVFEEGGYKYRVPGISITNSGTTTSFSARLLATDKTLDLYIVANATAAVLANEPQVGDTENEVRTKLQLGFPLGGNFTTLPMSGHYRLVSGLDANYRQEISGVSMLRAVARVDVLVGGITNFELTSIQAYRVNSRIQLIANQDLPVVTAPLYPNGGAVATRFLLPLIERRRLSGCARRRSWIFRPAGGGPAGSRPVIVLDHPLIERHSLSVVDRQRPYCLGLRAALRAVGLDRRLRPRSCTDKK